MPSHKRATYARFVVDVRPEKKDPNRVRITAGGDRLDYFGETSTESASLETAKILLNSVLSTKNAKFMSIDISNFYIQNDLEDYQWIRFHIDMIPQEIIDKYNLMNIVEDDGWCYAEIRKALYGLKEAAYISNVELKRVLAEEGYVPSKFTPGLFTHKTRDIAFALCTDDFGCRYVNKEDAEHLIETVKRRYPMTFSWEPDYYLGMTLKWDYEARTVECSMPGYVQEALLKFQHHYDGARHSSPSPHTPIQYRVKMQITKINKSDPMTKTQIKLL